MKPRARELGLPLQGEPGPHNAITDVPGVEVGYRTIRREEEQPAVRTGVTAILPFGKGGPLRPAWAGSFALNGNGEMTGLHWVKDGGYFVGPVCLTNTHSVGIVHHAAVRYMIDTYRGAFTSDHLWALPVVAETYDGVLSDVLGQRVTEEDALSAIAAARGGRVAEGSVGGGTGMICYGYKGGSGTSSRRVRTGGVEGVVGAFVQANFGRPDLLTVCGVPVGRLLAPGGAEPEMGSVIGVVATDLPMLPHQLGRVARRAALGIARTGSSGGNSSGDLFLAFSTANPSPLPRSGEDVLQFAALNDERFDPVYEAVCQAVEEAVLNALLAGEAMTAVRPAGREVPALDGETLLRVMRSYGPLSG